MTFDSVQFIFSLAAAASTVVTADGLVQWDDIFTLIVLLGCFLAFCFGWLIALLMLQV